jgi:hypothetical protein
MFIQKDQVIDDRIVNDIIVDAYDESERAMGWYYYLEGKLKFPFRAKCIEARRISPLIKGEEVEVIGMTSEEDCEREMFVEITWQGRTLGVPLSQLEGIKIDADTKEAIENWHYWVSMGYGF